MNKTLTIDLSETEYKKLLDCLIPTPNTELLIKLSEAWSNA